MGKMGRPLKFNEERAGKIVEYLRAGCTRKAAAEAVGVEYETLRLWLTRGRREQSGDYFAFLAAVTRAEAEVEARYTLIINKAATGWDTSSTTRTTKTVFRTKKTKQKDGTVIEEPVALQEVTETRHEGREFDPKYALEWLKRRRPEEWGDTMVIEVWRKAVEKARSLSDEDLLAKLGHGPSSPSSL
jgi:hypothetical protein